MHGSEGDKFLPVVNILLDLCVPTTCPKKVVSIINDLSFPKSDYRRDSLGDVKGLHRSADCATSKVQTLDDDVDSPFISVLNVARRGICVYGLTAGKSLTDREEDCGVEMARWRIGVLLLFEERKWRVVGSGAVRHADGSSTRSVGKEGLRVVVPPATSRGKRCTLQLGGIVRNLGAPQSTVLG